MQNNVRGANAGVSKITLVITSLHADLRSVINSSLEQAVGVAGVGSVERNFVESITIL